VTFYAAADATPLHITRGPEGVPDGSLRLWWRADAGVPSRHGDLWLDQSGHGNHGTQANGAAIARLVPGPNGLPTMSLDGGDALHFTARLTTIRSIFWVVKESGDATNAERPLLGDPPNDGWRGGFSGGRQIWRPDCCVRAEILNGQTRLNGVPILGTATARPRVPAVISLVTTGPVNASRFGPDNAGPGWGDLAELIVYDRALTNDERAAVETFLKSKYGIQ
jgi:hypothetical protein